MHNHAIQVITLFSIRAIQQYVAVVIFLLLTSVTHAQLLGNNSGDSEFLPVEQAYQVSVLDLDDRLLIRWDIADGYYLYKHAFSFKHHQKPLTADIVSEGIDKVDEYFGDVTVYYTAVDAEIVTTTAIEQLTLVSQGCADAGLCYPPRKQYFVKSSDGQWLETDSAPPAAATRPASNTAATPTTEVDTANNEAPPLVALLLLAFMGGLILNLMPCVLPVLTLKSLSFLKPGNAQHRIAQGWAYTAGVVLSFLALATAILLLKSAGNAVGWGFQLQDPLTIAALVYLFFIIGLNLLGGFHLQGPSVSGNSPSDGLGNAFFTGVLAVVVASPCTAPFMGTAIGASLALPAAQSLLIFATLGFGLAAPFLLISYLPYVGKWLPKPGAWMNTLKEWLAFPMFATAAWLTSVALTQTDSTGLLAILLICVALAMFLWLKKVQTFITLLVALLIAVGLSSMVVKPAQTAPQQPFELAQLDRLVATEDTVLVNVTASWCITCKINERVALKTTVTEQALLEHNVQYIVADWSNANPDISELLARYNRNGIPLYLLFRDGDLNNPTILPQLLKPSTIVDALNAP